MSASEPRGEPGEAGPSAYDVAHHYDAGYFADLADRYRQRNRFARRRIANVLSLLPTLGGARVVDLGCGMGTFTIETARRGAHAIGVDPSPAAISAAATVAAAEDVEARFVRADAAALPLPDACADIVIAADLVEHLDDRTLAEILREAARVLSLDGHLVVYTPDRSHALEAMRERGWLRQDPSHIAVRRAAQVARCVSDAGFEVLQNRALPSHLPGLDVLERLLARWVPLLRRRIGLMARKAR